MVSSLIKLSERDLHHWQVSWTLAVKDSGNPWDDIWPLREVSKSACLWLIYISLDCPSCDRSGPGRWQGIYARSGKNGEELLPPSKRLGTCLQWYRASFWSYYKRLVHSSAVFCILVCSCALSLQEASVELQPLDECSKNAGNSSCEFVQCSNNP